MPGILPLKTIQLSTSSQSRIAQACDRCRSKKIRCDGIQPNCTPCQAVNFECKTSDKLSRKAYPKGYTSSLEERVRDLESEIRELKDLLDEKDEKIDILSKMRQNSAPPLAAPTPPASTPSDHGREDTFRVTRAVRMYGKESRDQYFAGLSSSQAFLDSFKERLQETYHSPISIDTTALLRPISIPPIKANLRITTPPRVVSDQLINIFFQEWAPLIPVLHRPTFLNIYEAFISNPILKDARLHAQMYLVFAIAALSSMSNMDLLPLYEAQWRRALDASAADVSIETLQGLVLAQLYCIIKGDNQRLSHYAGIAVRMAHRLGLHQSQKAFDHEALKTETRKKVFWCLYTLDCFAAVSLGLPRLLKDCDVDTEEPANIDDENVSDRGFQATLPGEHTKISSAIALFRAAKLLAKVLDEVYPPSSRDISLSRVTGLAGELDAWRENLSSHLRLEFVQDKVNFNVTSDRSPLLALVYFYLKSCIHRPVVAANLGDKGLHSVIALADASKRIYQITKLLEQRQVSFTLPINQNELLALAGVGLLYQTLELQSGSKLARENQNIVASIGTLLGRGSKMASVALIKMSYMLHGKNTSPSPKQTRSPEGSMSPPKAPGWKASPKDQLQAIAARFSQANPRHHKRIDGDGRRATAPSPPIAYDLSIYSRSNSHASPASVKSAASEPMPSLGYEPTSMNIPHSSNALPNLDFLPIGSQPPTPDIMASFKPSSICEWDQLIHQFQPLDSHTPTGPYGTCADSLGTGHLSGQISPAALTGLDWSPNAWNILDASASTADGPSVAAQSVFSFSDESLTSVEDLSNCDLSSDYPGFVMPANEEFAAYSEFGVGNEYSSVGLSV